MTDKIVFYNIELEHLNDLKAVAQKLTAQLLMEKPSLSHSEIRELAFKVATVVNYAEVLHTFRNTPADKMYVHMLPIVYDDELALDIAHARARQPPELRDKFCRICGAFMLDSCPAAPKHDLVPTAAQAQPRDKP